MSNHINYYHYRCAVCSTKYDSLTKEPTGYNEEHLPILHYCPKHQPKVEQPVEQLTVSTCPKCGFRLNNSGECTNTPCNFKLEQLTPSISAIEQVIEQSKE